MEKDLKLETPTAGRHRILANGFNTLFVLFAGAGIISSILYIFHIRIFDFELMDKAYLYLILALFLPLVYLMLPATKKVNYLPWYDIIFALISFFIYIYLMLKTREILDNGLEFQPPLHLTIIAYTGTILVIEGGRRAAGPIFAYVVTFFAIYPLFASSMPGILMGWSTDWVQLSGSLAMGAESILGVPLRACGNLLVGYMLLAVALQVTGGGTFFLNFALSLLGMARGGTAKVAIIASAFFGSVSGSVVANVLTTGAITIPAMKKDGFPPHYAGGLEACASTGGTLMPPIMGAVAFVMVDFLNIGYATIVIAAAVPSFLFYLSLFLQIDAYAAKNNLHGLPKSEIPSTWRILKNGWFYMLALIALIWLLLYEQMTDRAPYYTTAILILAYLIDKGVRRCGRSAVDFFKQLSETIFQLIKQSGQVVAELVAILGAVGIIIGGLTITGVGHSFSREIILVAGGSIPFLLLLGALTSLLLGIGMTVTACYVFLAIVLAPALIKAGLNPLGVHLFIMYCGMLSFITPPVALGAYAAAGIAGASPMKTGFAAMRLGSIKFLLPFLFVLEPSLLLQGSNIGEIAFVLSSTLLGITLISGFLEGHLYVTVMNWWERIVVGLAGLMLASPWPDNARLYGGVLTIVILGVLFIRKFVMKPL